MTPTDDELNLAAAKLLGRVYSLDEYEQSDEADFTGFTDCGRYVMDNRTMDGFRPATEIADAMRCVERFQKWELRRFHFMYGATVNAGDWVEADTAARALTLAAVRAAATPGEKGSA